MRKETSWFKWKTISKNETIHKLFHQVGCYTLVVLLAASQMVYVHGEEAVTQSETSQTQEQRETKKIVSFKNFEADGKKPYQEIEAEKGTSEEALGLPKTLDVVLQDASEEEIAITWKCIDDSFSHAAYDSNNLNAVFTFEAVLPTGYAIEKEEVVMPWLNVQLKEKQAEHQAAAAPLARINIDGYENIYQILTVYDWKDSSYDSINEGGSLKACIAAAKSNQTTLLELGVQGFGANSFYANETITIDGNKTIIIKTRREKSTANILARTSQLFVVEKGSTLIVDDVVIKGAKRAANGLSVIEVNGKLILNNHAVIQDFNFTDGATGLITLREATSSLEMNEGSKITNNITSGSPIRVTNKKAVVVMNGGEISNNTTKSSGGAIWNAGDLTIHGGTITGNSAASSGGAIYQQYKLTIKDGTFTNNSVQNGGGGFLYIPTPTSSPVGSTTIQGGSFIGNIANTKNENQGGGAIFMSPGLYNVGDTYTDDFTNTLRIYGGTFRSNKMVYTGDEEGVKSKGGAFYLGSIYSAKTDGSLGKYQNMAVYLYGGYIDSSNSAELGNGIYYAASDTIEKKQEDYYHTPDPYDHSSRFFMNGKMTIKGIQYIYNSAKVSNGAGRLVYTKPIILNDAIQHSMMFEATQYSEGYVMRPSASGEIGNAYIAVTKADAEKVHLVDENYHTDHSYGSAISIDSGSPNYKDIVHVDGNRGDDETGDGSKDNPYGSLEEAIDHVKPGGTIIVDDTVNVTDEEIVELPGDGTNNTVTIKPSDNCSIGTDTCQDGVIVVKPGGNLVIGPSEVETPIDVEEGGNLTTSTNTTIKQSFIKQPESILRLQGMPASLEVAMTKYDGFTYTYQWYQNTTSSTAGAQAVDQQSKVVITLDTQTLGTTYYYCVVTVLDANGSASEYVSNIAKVEITESQLDKVEAKDETEKGRQDGKLLNVSDIMEYKRKEDAAFTSVPKGKTAIENLPAGTYIIQYQGTELSREITIKEGAFIFHEHEITSQNSRSATYKQTKPQGNFTVKNNNLLAMKNIHVEIDSPLFSMNKYEETLASQKELRFTYMMDDFMPVGEYKANVTIKYEIHGETHKIVQAIKAVVDKRYINVSFKNDLMISKTYDGTSDVKLDSTMLKIRGEDIAENDDVQVQIDHASFDDESVGNDKRVCAELSLTGNDANNYSISSSIYSYSGVILAMPLQVQLKGDVTIQKVYDGKTDIALDASYFEIKGGVAAGDDIRVTGTGHFDNKNEGKDKTIILDSFKVEGKDAAKYEVESKRIETKGTILAKQIRVSGNTPITRAYDKTTAATLTNKNYTLEGMLSNDHADLTYTAAFDGADVGTYRVLVTDCALKGEDAHNYSLINSEFVIQGNTITPRTLRLVVKDGKRITKLYDGTTDITVDTNLLALENLMKEDESEVTFSIGKAYFKDSSIGSQIVSIENVQISGAGAKNYALEAASVEVAGTINKHKLKLSMTTDLKKEYDGTNDIELPSDCFSIAGLQHGHEQVHATATASFRDKNAGENKDIDVTDFVLTGDDAFMYEVENDAITIKGDITKREISIQAGDALTKVYDGTKEATLQKENYTFDNMVKEDQLFVAYEAAFDLATVDAGKVSVTKLVLAGKDKANYILKDDRFELAGRITPKSVDIIWKCADTYTYNQKDQSSTITAYYKAVNEKEVPVTYTFKNGAVFQNAQTYEAVVTTTDKNYTFHNTTRSFTIASKALSKDMISGIKDSYVYTTEEIKPIPTIKDGVTLEEHKEYTLKYEDNINRGIAKIRITGMGNYTGEIVQEFGIGYALFEGSVLPTEGRNDAGYYKKDIALTIPEGYMFSLDDQHYVDHYTLREEDVNKELMYYLKDQKGLRYTNSEAYSLDKTAPVLKGIQQDMTYYVDQLVYIQEANLKEITRNGKIIHSNDVLVVEGNANVDYTIQAVDMADNETTIHFTMKPIRSILPNITLEHAKDGDQSAIKDAINTLNAMDVTNASDAQCKEIKTHLKDLQALLDTLTAIDVAIQDIHTRYEAIVSKPLTIYDKETLNTLAKDIQSLLDGDNLSEKQREDLQNLAKDIQKALEDVDAILKMYEDAKHIIDAVTVETVKPSDKKDIQKAIQELNDLLDKKNLTEEQQEEANALIKKAEELLKHLEEIIDKIKDVHDRYDEVVKDPLHSDDKDELVSIKNNIEQLLNGNNLSDEQRNDLKDLLEKVTDALKGIENIEKKFNDAKEVITKADISTIQPKDKDQIEQARKDLNELLDKDNLTKEQREEAEALIKKAEELLKHLEEIADKIKDLHDRYDQIDKEHLNTDDKTALEELKKDIEGLLNGDNLSEDQRNDLKDLYDEVKEAIHKVEAIEKAYDDAKKVIVDNTVDDVKTDDKQSIQDAIDTLNKLKDQEHVNEEQKKEVEELIQKGQDLLDKIKEVEDKLSHIDDVEHITKDTVTKEDSQKINEVLNRIEDLENNHMGNLNDQQKEEVEKQKEHAQELEKIIDEIKKVEDMIHALPKPVTNEEEYHQALEAKDAYDKLSPNQKEQIDDAILDSLENILNHYGNAILYDDPTGIMVEGIEYYFLPHIRLHVDVVTKNTPAAIHSAIQNQMTNHEILSEVYDITLMANNETIQPKGKVNVYIPLTKEQRAYKALRLVSINAQGEVLEIESRREGDFLVFTTDHFSYYAIIGETMANGNQGNGDVTTADHTDIHMYMLMMLVSLGFLIGMKKKYRKQ